MGLTKKQVIDRMSVSEARAALEAAIARNNKETERRNRQFARLSNARKRVVIAQDVLDQLDLRRLVPTFGKYLEVPDEVAQKFSSWDDDDESIQVHEALDGVSCKVCGIGSLFVAAVDRANECTVADMDQPQNDYFMREYLGDFFDLEQLVLVEAAFEGRLINSMETDLTEYSPEVLAAIRFASKVRSASGRLKKIMQNIVDNGGTFVP